MKENYEPGHKFDSALTAYAHDNIIMVSGQDDDASDGMGNSVALIGRRLLIEDDRGFVWMETFPNMEEAARDFADRAAALLRDDEEEGPQDEFSPTDPELPAGTYIVVTGYDGVAFYVTAASADQVRAIMVGDDHTHTVDRDDVTLIPREDFCGECGQVGCAHDGLDRD